MELEVIELCRCKLLGVFMDQNSLRVSILFIGGFGIELIFMSMLVTFTKSVLQLIVWFIFRTIIF